MPNFETTFLAIASKNSFLTHEEAAEVLTEFNNQTGRSIEDIVLAHGLLTAEQVRIISAGAKKILGIPTEGAPRPSTQRIPTQPPPGGAVPSPRPGTQRIPTQPPPKPNPAEPIPGIRISGKLGVGGTATVFLADDLRNNRKVALKIMHPSLA